MQHLLQAEAGESRGDGDVPGIRSFRDDTDCQPAQEFRDHLRHRQGYRGTLRDRFSGQGFQKAGRIQAVH